MAKRREPINPFYFLLVILGVAFLITAIAYYVMALIANAPAGGRRPADHPLTDFLDRHGITLLAWELVLLGAASFAAMALDRIRFLRRQSHATQHPAAKTDAEPGRDIE